MARGYAQSRSEGNAGDGIGQKQAFDRIPKGTVLPFGTIGDDIKNENDLHDSFANLLLDDSPDYIPDELEEASPGFSEEAQSLSETAQEDAENVGSPDDYTGAGESGAVKRVFNFPGTPPIEIEYSIEMESSWDEEDGGFNPGRFSFNLKNVKIL